MKRTGRSMRFAVLALVVLAACAVQPRDIHLGSEACAHCHMVIDDLRFAAQALTPQGAAHTFDAIECLVEWLAADAERADALHSVWVSDFSDPGTWVRADDARFLHASELRSPMGGSMVAFGSADDARGIQQEVGGELLTWTEVREVVGTAVGGHHHHAEAHR